ncbi:hypothetical protein E2C01_054066 [Portunus trituberculatus]|uniref:Uncharacterized protein n=1 Tax=Portunus trituberculatus TaxID=210409 RepID=A0A5B7GM47_PORTR|nr:hypothetical protein [Portunus trituberculatus]
MLAGWSLFHQITRMGEGRLGNIMCMPSTQLMKEAKISRSAALSTDPLLNVQETGRPTAIWEKLGSFRPPFGGTCRARRPRPFDSGLCGPSQPATHLTPSATCLTDVSGAICP